MIYIRSDIRCLQQNISKREDRVVNPGHECKDVFEDLGFTHKEASDLCKDPDVLIKGGEHCRDFAKSFGQDPEIAHEICQILFTHKVAKSS